MRLGIECGRSTFVELDVQLGELMHFRRIALTSARRDSIVTVSSASSSDTSMKINERKRTRFVGIYQEVVDSQQSALDGWNYDWD